MMDGKNRENVIRQQSSSNNKIHKFDMDQKISQSNTQIREANNEPRRVGDKNHIIDNNFVWPMMNHCTNRTAHENYERKYIKYLKTCRKLCQRITIQWREIHFF